MGKESPDRWGKNYLYSVRVRVTECMDIPWSMDVPILHGMLPVRASHRYPISPVLIYHPLHSIDEEVEVVEAVGEGEALLSAV